MPKVSVIVPVYGVEKYIERCARNLFEQTLDDIEYLFINDCSPDRSIEILQQVLEEYPQRKPQVIIHRMPSNSGQAAVRNWGMQNATGEFIIHCDSDDFVDVNIYKMMYECACRESADIVVCDYYYYNDKHKTFICGCNNGDKQEFFKNLLLQKESCVLWNKLIRKSVCCKDLIWAKGNMGEDMLLCLQFVNNSTKIFHVPIPLYYYLENPLSISRKMSENAILNRFNQSIKNAECLILFFKKADLYFKYQDALDYILFQKKNLLRPLIGIPKYYKLWFNTYSELNKSIFLNREVSASQKIKHLLALLRLYRR